MNFGKLYHFISGHFEWDFLTRGIIFVSHEIVAPEPKKPEETKVVEPETSLVPGQYDITFNDDIDLAEKIKFRKFYQRRYKFDEEQYVLLQDVKDVTLFMANPKQLTIEFLDFFHNPIVDQFLRALILYFQLYFQVWNKMLEKRCEMNRKITVPTLNEREIVSRDDLSELRCIVGREYCSMLSGLKDLKKFHHMMSHNGLSLSDKDRRLYEMLIKVSSRVVWIALHKPTLSVIEYEMDRLTRSNAFNKFEHHLKKFKTFYTIEKENKILRGVTYASERQQSKLIVRSPLGKEVLIADHDPRILTLGQVDFPPSDERIRFLEAAYLLPEEQLAEYGICVGILGKPRSEFDTVLKLKRKKVDDEDSSVEIVFEFQMPPRVQHSKKTIPSIYPEEPPRIAVSSERQKIVEEQCLIWKVRTYKARHNIDVSGQEFTIRSSVSSTYLPLD